LKLTEKESAALSDLINHILGQIAVSNVIHLFKIVLSNANLGNGLSSDSN